MFTVCSTQHPSPSCAFALQLSWWGKAERSYDYFRASSSPTRNERLPASPCHSSVNGARLRKSLGHASSAKLATSSLRHGSDEKLSTNAEGRPSTSRPSVPGSDLTAHTMLRVVVVGQGLAGGKGSSASLAHMLESREESWQIASPASTPAPASQI